MTKLINKYKRILILSLVLFMLIYDISFIGSGIFTTGRVALLILILISGIDSINHFSRFILRRGRAAFIFIFICIYSFVLVVFSEHNDWTIFSRSFWFIIHSLFAPFLIIVLCRFDLKLFLRAYFLSAIFQSFFSFLSISNPEYRLWTHNNINIGGNLDSEQTFRSFGLSGSGGAILSLQLSLGFLSGILLFKDKDIKSSLTNSFILFSGLFIIFGAEIFVGRTGMLFCIISFLFFFLIDHFRRVSARRLFGFLLSGIIAAFSFNHFTQNGLAVSNYDSDFIMEWALSVFSEKGDGTVSELKRQLNDAPPLDGITFLTGSGRVVNSNGYNFSGSDSGYIQNIYALGAPISLLFYSALLMLFLSLFSGINRNYKHIGVFIILACFVLEVKEPFIHKYTLVQFIITFLLLLNYSPSNTNRSSNMFI